MKAKREGGISQPMTKTDEKMPMAMKGSIAGKWKIETNAQGQAITIEVNFKQDGDMLSGTVSSDVRRRNC